MYLIPVSYTHLGASSAIFKEQGVNVLVNMFFGVLFNAARGISMQVYGVVSQFSYSIGQAITPQITKEYCRNSWYDAGGIAADHLATMGCGTLDYLILTHYDYDHVSGVTELLARTRVGTLLLPDVADDAGMRLQVELAARDHGADIRYVRAETSLPLGRSSLTIYPPGDVKGDNEQCLAILCTYGDYDLLITGDMNMAAERQLIADHDLPDIEALVVGHHGSKSSTSKVETPANC